MLEAIEPSEAMAANRANWDARVPIHVGPGGYDLESFATDPNHLSDVVAFDKDRLGELDGLDVVHLQCHIATDTVSLARLGATVTGLDFSPESIAEAQRLADVCGVAARFEVANVYDAPAALGDSYDLVYTGIGALNWLPDIRRWAVVVSALLRPGGRLHLFEMHPMLGALADEATADALLLHWPYFETAEAMRWEETDTYEGTGVVSSPLQYEWAHGLGEVVQAVLDAGLTLDRLEEHRVLPWERMDWFERVEGTRHWTQMPEHLRDIVPLSYCLQATNHPT